MLHPFHYMRHEINRLPRRLCKLAGRGDEGAKLRELVRLHTIRLISLPEKGYPHQPVIEISGEFFIDGVGVEGGQPVLDIHKRGDIGGRTV